MNAEFIISKQKELDLLINEQREIQERERFETLVNLYNLFCEKYKELDPLIYLNRDLLVIIIKSYFDDIYRFKLYSHSIRADKPKQAAYTIKWISKIRPIQILQSEEPASKNVLLANSMFAIFVGFSLMELDDKQIEESFISQLIYMTEYRNISGRQLSITMNMLQQLHIK